MVVPERPFVTETQFSVAHQESSSQVAPTGRKVGCGAHTCGGTRTIRVGSRTMCGLSAESTSGTGLIAARHK